MTQMNDDDMAVRKPKKRRQVPAATQANSDSQEIPDERAITDDVSALLQAASQVRRRRGTPTPTKPLNRKQVKQAQRQRRQQASTNHEVPPPPRRQRKAAAKKKPAHNANNASNNKTVAQAAAEELSPRLASEATMAAALSQEHGLSLRPVVSVVALLLCFVMAVSAWQRSPRQPELTVIEQPPAVPAPVMRSWLLGFPAFRALRQQPDRNVIEAFADYLDEQPSVASVERIGIRWRRQEGQLRRSLSWDVTLRQPLLPLRLASGDLRWVDEEGVLLPGDLAGDVEQPEVIHYERSQRPDGSSPALAMLLAIWPPLQRELATIPGLKLSHIDLFHRLDHHSRAHGVVLVTTGGTRLIWGGPGEDQFGVDWPRRISQLGHALRCQGDLNQVSVINARFSDPYSIPRQ